MSEFLHNSLTLLGQIPSEPTPFNPVVLLFQIFILLSSKNETLTILCSVSKDLQSRISAKDLINALTSPIEGKGGGRVEFAQGAGKPSDREKFVSDIPNIVQSLA